MVMFPSNVTAHCSSCGLSTGGACKVPHAPLLVGHVRRTAGNMLLPQWGRPPRTIFLAARCLPPLSVRPGGELACAAPDAHGHSRAGQAVRALAPFLCRGAGNVRCSAAGLRPVGVGGPGRGEILRGTHAARARI